MPNRITRSEALFGSVRTDRLNVGGVDIPTTYGRSWYVDTNRSASGGGRSWSSAFLTMQEAFNVVSSGDKIYFVGNIREQLTTPTGAADVTIIGSGTRPRHADTHPLNGQLSGATWKLPVSSTNVPLLIVRNPGWRIINVLFAAHASNYALRLDRTADEDATEQDASHLDVLGCRFASGAGGISDVGGCFNVRIEGCHFMALTTACILGVGNIGVGQLGWEILNNHFNNFTNGVKIAGHECVIKGNYFTDGGTPNTTFVLNTNNGGGRDNFIVDNYFQTSAANFNTPDVVGTATDVWNNTSIDGTADFIGREVGQPA
jgi:hypothetical protein